MKALNLVLITLTVLLWTSTYSTAQDNSREIKVPSRGEARELREVPSPQSRAYFSGHVEDRDDWDESSRSSGYPDPRFSSRDHDDSLATMGRPIGRTSMMRMMIILMDIDGSGSVSLQEWQAGQERIFKSMDANKDGGLTLEEARGFRRSFERNR